MEQHYKKDNLERIALQLASSLNLQEVLTSITQGLVDEIAATFARIWLIGPGDICSKCYKADTCSNRDRCLHLKASSGMYRNLNGEYRRLPLNTLKIGKIATDGEPVYTNKVLGDDRLQNQQWIKENGFQSFAGYPLVFRKELLGVIAMFSRKALPQTEFESLELFANQAATAIKNAQLFGEVDRLKHKLQAECIYLQKEIKLRHNYEEIIGESESFRKALSMVDQVAGTDATVLILGETGTGKELIARAIHSKSARGERPLVKVNCAALPASLIESELFGHEKGAFTGAITAKAGRFELADGGTIFLDEIGDLHMELQAKLLRVLQDGTFERVGGTHTQKLDTRVIAATNVVLEQAMKSGKFRSDLYYRLSVFPIHLPPLRERKEDIPLLAAHFAAKYSKKFGKTVKPISPALNAALQSYALPGNVRELENIIERAVITATESELHLDELFLSIVRHHSSSTGFKTLQEAERDYILETLERCRWVIEGTGGAASLLEIHPATLRSRMKKLGIQRPA